MTSPDPPGRTPTPSLFAAEGPLAWSTAASGQPAELRMLAGLETRRDGPRGGSAQPRRTLIAALIGGLLVVGAAAGWQLSRDPAPAGSAAPAAPSVATSLPAAAEPPASPPVPTPAAEAQPAPAAPMSTAVASPPDPAPRAVPHRASTAPMAVKPAAPVPKLTAAAPGGDSDVDLLAALVIHLEGNTRRAATSASGKPAPVRKPTLQASTIEQLVRSCRQFGGSEEAQCRRQICEGNWGRAASCPARLASSRAPVAKR